MKLSLLLLSALHQTRAFVDPTDLNGTVAENSFVDPNLSKPIDGSEAFLQQDPIEIPSEVVAQVNTLEEAVGAEPNSTRIDLKSGRIESLTLSDPILPGPGYNNGLLLTVNTAEESEHDGKLSKQAWEEFAIAAVKNWMTDHASELNINVETELFAEGTVRTAVHGDGDTIQMHIPRIFKGVPVQGARAMATIKLGNLIEVGFEEWGTIPEEFDVEPSVTKEEAYAAVAAHAERERIEGEEECEPELQILTMTPPSSDFGGGYDYALAWRVCPLLEGQESEIMEGLVDAKDGRIYSFQDMVHYAQATGGVYPIANDGRFPDGIAQAGWPMPYMWVGGELTDTGGNYESTGSVTASFDGKYVRISDRCGSASLTSSGGLNWGTSSGTDCSTPGYGGAGNTHSARTNVYELNKAMEMARSHLPNNSWLQRRLTVNVNINSSCNAYWSGTINFYRKGGSCGNTGELAGVIVHEWGHGLDNNDVTGSIAQPSGEGIADIYAALRMGDSCIGRGFYVNKGGCSGVRNIDRVTAGAKTLTNNNCNGAVHCVGQIYSQAIWSLYKRKLQSYPYNYDDNTALEIVTRLTFIAAGNVNTWFDSSGGCNSASGYKQYLAADDDNGNINDGTPHMRAIYEAFNEQEIACSSPTVRDSGCAGTPTSSAAVTLIPGDKRVVINWSAVSGASSYEVFRTEGVKGCAQGKVKLKSTTLRSVTDTGLMNGRTYYYTVIAKGPNDSCFGPSSPCMSAIPLEDFSPSSPPPTPKPVTAAPITPSPTRKPIPPTNPPTSQPTRQCGNGVCESNESSSSCPEDCASLELSAIGNSDRGAPGVMFWVNAPSRDIAVSSFKFYSWVAETAFVQVYSRTGEYTGFERNQNGWELVHEQTLDLLGENTMTKLSLPNKVTVSGGATRSFFIWVTSGNIRFDEGTSEGGLWNSDSFLEIYEGVSLMSTFSPDAIINSPRRFNGIISYDVVTSNPTLKPTSPPTSQPTQPPTNNPTNPPTNNPTSFPTTSSPTRHPTRNPTSPPSVKPMIAPSNKPTTNAPTTQPPTQHPVTSSPTDAPTNKPTPVPTTATPSKRPTKPPTKKPITPTNRPTSPPTSACNNNGTCQPQETATTCPQDCGNLNLEGTNTGTSYGAPGVMFDMTSKRDVTVKSLEFFTDAARNDLIQVYTRPGSYLGRELDPSGWQLIFSKNVNQMGRDVTTKLGDFDTTVTIPAGSTQAFFITSNFYIMYDLGNVEGGVLSEDESLIIHEGAGLSSVFPGVVATGKKYSPRIFKGSVSYDAVQFNPVTTSPTERPSPNPTKRPVTPSPSKKPITPQPTKKPTVPTNRPTSPPTPNPTKRPVTPSPSKKPTTQPTKKPTTPTNKPTSPPTSACNNDGTCQPQETATSCPQDCSGLVLNAHNAGTDYGAPGVMFDMTSKRDVTVKSFDIYTDGLRNDLIQVYTRPGSYQGHELVQSGWQLIYSRKVNQMGRDVATKLGGFDTTVTIPAGSTRAFFVTSNFYVMYDKGTVEGGVLSEDESLIIHEGAGLSSVFPGTGSSGVKYSPRIFKGDIRYDRV